MERHISALSRSCNGKYGTKAIEVERGDALGTKQKNHFDNGRATESLVDINLAKG